MLLKNTSSVRVVCEALGFAVEPGDTVQVDDGYCVPRPAVPGTKPQECVVKMLCPQLVPADPALLDAWQANTLDIKPAAPPAPTAAQLAATGLPPAVAELVASGQAAQAPKPPTRSQVTAAVNKAVTPKTGG
jgi:hypothetical protein